VRRLRQLWGSLTGARLRKARKRHRRAAMELDSALRAVVEGGSRMPSGADALPVPKE
jgi:hypothetical protein